MIRRLYDWTLNIASHTNSRYGLAAVSFAESSFFPIPPDVLLIPMCLAQKENSFAYALICTLASVVGGLFGYLIGFFLFESIGEYVFRVYNADEAFLRFKEAYNAWGFWIVLGAGLTPFPYKIVTISSGLLGLNLPVFLIGSLLSRGVRFYLVAGLIWYFGRPIRDFIEKYLGLLATLFFILLLGGFLLIRYI